MHRVPPAIVIAVLVLATIMASASLAIRVRTAPVHGNGDETSLAVVERYYDAVNLMIASGDPEPLRQIIDPEAIDLEPAPAGLAGPEGLVRYLHSLRTTLPGIRIEPGQLYAAEVGIVAQPTVVGDADMSVPGFSIEERQRIWPEVERFHVQHGRIVERSFKWSGLVLARLLPVDDSALAIAPRRQVEAGIYVLPPGATVSGVTAETPETLLPLTDGVTFQLSGTATSPAIAHTASQTGAMARHFIAPGDAATVAPGEVITVPRGSAYSVSNYRSAPAELFVLSVSVALSATDAAAPEAPLPFDGSEGKSLVLIESTRDDEWQLESGRVWLMPGAELKIAPQTRLMALCQAVGEIRCLIWLPGKDPMTPGEEFAVSGAESPVVLLSRVGAPDALMNLGEEAVLLWAFSVG